jgi:hypothetical protein
LPPHRFPVPPSTRGRGLKGNAVKIGNSSRCCKFPERGSPPPHRVPAIFATGHRAGKAPEQERVRRPARAFTDSLLRRMEANTGGFLHPRNRRIVTGRQTLRHSHPSCSVSTPFDELYYGRMMGFVWFILRAAACRPTAAAWPARVRCTRAPSSPSGSVLLFFKPNIR